MIVVDILCVYSCLKILARYRNKKTVYFVMRSNGLIDHLTVQLLIRLGWRFVPLEYDFTPTDNRMPFFDVQRDLEDFFDNYISPKIQKQIYNHRYLSEYEKKRVSTYLEILSKQEIYRSIEILHILEICGVRIGEPKLVLLSNARWRYELIDAYKKRGYEVTFYNVLLMRALPQRDKYVMDYFVKASLRSRPNLLFKAVYLVSKVVITIGNCICYRVLRCMNSALPLPLGKFDVGAIIDSGYGRSAWFNDLFWRRELNGNGLPTLAILYGYFDDRAFKTYGYLANRWISLDKDIQSPSISIPSIFYWLWPLYPKILFSNLTRLLKGFFESKTRVYHWFEMINLWIEVSRMEVLFRITGIKILWTSIEGQNLISLAGSLAIKRINGVSVGSTWSLYGYPLDFRAHRNTLDIWFIWGRQHADLLQDELCKFMIICGYCGDFYLKDHMKRGMDLRAKWKNEYGVKTIICYYDNVIGNDMHNFFIPATKNFQNILSWIKEQPDSLLAIKSKRKEIFSRYPESAKKLLKELEGQKRIIYEFKKADLTPGFASDIVLGFGMATLPCLLGAYGKEVILLDVNEFNKRTPINLKNINFFKNHEEVTKYLDRWKFTRDNCLTKETEQITPYSSRIDPFVDGCVSQRVANYILNLVYGLKNGLNSDMAINNANREYSNRWGQDKVINLNKL